MSTGINTEGLSLPLDIRNVAAVDDAGGEHFECQMTGAYLVDLYRSGLLKLTGNIRPAHSQEQVTGKTSTKIDKWTSELLATTRSSATSRSGSTPRSRSSRLGRRRDRATTDHH